MNGIVTYRSFPLFFSLVLLSLAIGLLTREYIILGIVPALLLVLLGFQKPRILFFLLLSTIPLSVELPLAKFGTDFPDEMLMWLLTAIIPLILVLRPQDDLRKLLHPLILLLLLGLCWTLITMIYSEHSFLSFKYFLAKTWYILPFCVGTMLFLHDKKSIIIAAKCMLLAMMVATAFVFVRHAITGFSFEQVNNVARPLFRNHVNYAALLVCMLPVSYAVFRYSTRSKLFWLSLLLFFLVALFFTYSRGSWLALAAGLITLIFVRKNLLAWLVVPSMVMLMGILAWFATGNRYLNYRPVYEQTIYHSNFDEHIAATYSMRDLSTAERFYRWIAAIRMSRERLITGYGPNSFYYEYRPYAVNSFATYVSNNLEHSTVHNYYLLLLTEQGIPGLLLFLALFFSMLFSAQRIYHRESDPWEKGKALVIVSLLSMIGVLIFLSDLMETDKTGSLFFICLGLLVSSQKKTSLI